MDFVEGLPISNELNFIIVIMHRLNKYVHFT